jgi:hypothetical protein
MHAERMAEFAGWATLAIGASLLLAPRRTTGPLGLGGEEAAFRALGVADLVLVPGLLRGTPRWPWMTARAALNVGDAVYLLRAARRSSSPARLRAGAAVMVALTAIDSATARDLRRAPPDHAGDA